MKRVLKNDLLIPKGTVFTFDRIADTSEKENNILLGATVYTKNPTGVITWIIDEKPQIIEKWFDVKDEK